MIRAKLYYEVHITVPAPSTSSDVLWRLFLTDAKRLGFKASKFDVDEVDDASGMWFLTARYTDLPTAKLKVRNAIMALATEGYKVDRWKIEETLLDSKHGSKLEELGVD